MGPGGALDFERKGRFFLHIEKSISNLIEHSSKGSPLFLTPLIVCSDDDGLSITQSEVAD